MHSTMIVGAILLGIAIVIVAILKIIELLGEM